MKKQILLAFTILLLFGSNFAQDSLQNNGWKLYPTAKDSAKQAVTTDSIYEIKKAEKSGKVVVIKDSRIDKVSKDLAGGVSKKPKAKGYRVQVISSSTKAAVDGERIKLIAANRQHRTYIDYKAPNFRLRVGNFRTRLEAEKFQNEIKGKYPNTLIVVDLIDFPELD
jgi:hypothetical protein